jgi:hypothetical protein
LPLGYSGNPGVNDESDRGGPHPVKGYIMYSIISGIVYPVTGGGPHPVKGYILYNIISGIVYPFTGVC